MRLYNGLYTALVVGSMAAFLVASITHRALNFVERRLDRGAYVLHLFPILAAITLLVTSSVFPTSPIGVAIALSVNLVLPAALAYLIVRAGLYPGIPPAQACDSASTSRQSLRNVSS